MNQKERNKAYLTIVLSMILGLVCFALAGLFFSAAFAQSEYKTNSNVLERLEPQIQRQRFLLQD